MFSSLTFQKRLLATVILSGVFFLLLALLYTLDYRSKLTEKIMQEQSEVLQVVLRERIQAKENGAASKTSNAAKQISLSTQQQKAASKQVVIALHDITSSSRINAQSVRDISDISQEMLEVSEHLQALVNEFEMGDV